MENTSTTVNDNNLNNDNSKQIQNVSINSKKFEVEKIIDNCKIKDNTQFVNYLCEVMHEKQRDIIEALFKQLGKDYLIAKLESTLNIENKGGLRKEECNTKKENAPTKIENKSTGGVFFTLIKKDPEGKSVLVKASKINWKKIKQKKRMDNLLQKMDTLNV